MAGRLTLAEQAIDCFGFENQTRKAAEECLELASSLLKLKDLANGDIDATIETVIKEIADVKVCIEQLEKIFDSEAIAKAKKEKENRLFDTICRFRSERNVGGLAALPSGKVACA